MKKKLWWGIAALVLVSPLGLILPEVFRSGPAWGEWSLEEIEKAAGFIPEGVKRLSNLWSAPVPDYNFRAWEGKGFAKSGLAYIFSGILGAGVIVCVSFFVGRILVRKKRNEPQGTKCGLAPTKPDDLTPSPSPSPPNRGRGLG